jgi:hypothetical protein
MVEKYWTYQDTVAFSKVIIRVTRFMSNQKFYQGSGVIKF